MYLRTSEFVDGVGVGDVQNLRAGFSGVKGFCMGFGGGGVVGERGFGRRWRRERLRERALDILGYGEGERERVRVGKEGGVL